MAPGLPGEIRMGLTAFNVVRAIVSLEGDCQPCPCGIARHGGLDRAEGAVRLELYAEPESRGAGELRRKPAKDRLLPLVDRAHTRFAAYRNRRRRAEGSSTPP